MNEEIIVAFQTWDGGHSGIYFAEGYRPENFGNRDGISAQEFVKQHHESGTFATLNTFNTLEEGLRAWGKLFDPHPVGVDYLDEDTNKIVYSSDRY